MARIIYVPTSSTERTRFSETQRGFVDGTASSSNV
jgi:hypothetical protein